MPYTIRRRGTEYCVVKVGEESGRSFGCHPTKQEAVRQIAAIEANEAKRKQTQEELDEMYYELVEEARSEMVTYADELVDGEIDRMEFRRRMRSRIKTLTIALALLASDGQFSPDIEDDLNDLEFFTDSIYALLDDFVEGMEEYSEPYIRWRASLYANHRHIFIRYGVPRELFFLLPELPGVSCLGDGWCGCWLLVDETADTWEVFWQINPDREHCTICLGLSTQWDPLVIDKR